MRLNADKDEIDNIVVVFTMNQRTCIHAYKTLLTAIVFILLYGCAAVGKYLVSGATMDSDKFRITNVGKLEIGQTVIIVKPTNALNTFRGGEILMIPQYSRNYEPKDYAYSFTYYEDYNYGRKGTPGFFILELLVVTNNEEVMFHPQKIVLMLNDQEIYPASYFNLERRYQGFLSLAFHTPLSHLCKSPGTETWSPSNPLKLAEEVNTENPISLEKMHSYCFAVKFKTPPPDPRTSFSVKFNGVKINGDDMHLPEIRYTPKKYTERHT